MAPRVALILSLVGAMSAPSTARAQSRWVLLAIGEPRMEADSSSSRRHEDHLDVWIRETFTKPQDLTPTAPKRLLYKNSIDHWAIDCARRRYQIIQSVYHSAEGQSVHSFEGSESTEGWKAVIPETIGEAAVDSVCANDALFDGTFSRAAAAYADRWRLIDSARTLACAANDPAEVVPMCRALRALRSDSPKAQTDRWALRWKVDSILGNTWPEPPTRKASRRP